MSTQPLPTAYELCRIVAALRGRAAVKKPVEAAKEALGLWLAAAYELGKAAKRDFHGNLVAYTEPFNENEHGLEAEYHRDLGKAQDAQNPNPDDQRLAFTKRDDNGKITGTPALDWLNANAPHERERFKTYRTFEREWLKYDPDPRRLGFPVRVCELNRFIAFREKKRRDADNERQRQKRQQEKAPKKLARKIAAGQHSTPSRKKA